MRTVGEADIDGSAPLAAGSIEAIVGMTAPWVAYDRRYGGASDKHDKVFIMRDGEFAVLIRPADPGGWALQTLDVDTRRDTQLLAAHPELNTPDFVAAGPMTAEIPGYRANRTIVFASGSKVMLLYLGSYHDSTATFAEKERGFVLSQAADLSALVGPSREGYRMFAEVMQGMKVHALPWTDGGPDASRPGFTLELVAAFGRSTALRLTRRTLS